MRTSEVATKLGVSASWLRKLEQAGKIPKARRDGLSGHRRYTEEDLEQLRDLLYPPEPAPPAGPPPVMVEVVLKLSHTVNGVRYGPGLTEVPEKLVRDLLAAEDAARRASV